MEQLLPIFLTLLIGGIFILVFIVVPDRRRKNRFTAIQNMLHEVSNFPEINENIAKSQAKSIKRINLRGKFLVILVFFFIIVMFISTIIALSSPLHGLVLVGNILSSLALLAISYLAFDLLISPKLKAKEKLLENISIKIELLDELSETSGSLKIIEFKNAKITINEDGDLDILTSEKLDIRDETKTTEQKGEDPLR